MCRFSGSFDMDPILDKNDSQMDPFSTETCLKANIFQTQGLFEKWVYKIIRNGYLCLPKWPLQMGKGFKSKTPMIEQNLYCFIISDDFEFNRWEFRIKHFKRQNLLKPDPSPKA